MLTWNTRGSGVQRWKDLDDMLVAFRELTSKVPKYLFLDEIQSVKNYGSWFRKRLNARCISLVLHRL